MLTYDFARSYLRFRVDLAAQPAITLSHKMPTTENNVRINIECRCQIAHRPSGQAVVYALGASCKTERVGAERGQLWIQPNADFCLTLSEDEFLIIKNWQKRDMGVMRVPASLGVQPQRQIGSPREAWVSSSVELRETPGRELPTIDAIIEAIRGGNPLVARCQYDEGDYRVTLDHPVKTINYSEREKVFQTDTGPLLLPDLTPARIAQARREAAPAPGGGPGAVSEVRGLIGCLDLAFAAFHAADWAEFIVQAPVELAPGVAVNHYAQARRIEPMRNTLVEVA